MNKGLSPRIALVLIAALFIGPLAVAWLMYEGVIDFSPASTRNLGELVEPPRPISWAGVVTDAGSPVDADTFGRHWLVLHALPANCDDDCLATVTSIRQVHRAAGRNQERIHLALLAARGDAATRERLHDIYDSFVVLEDPGRAMWRTLDAIAAEAVPPAPAAGGTYLVDPLGNIMMYYANGSDPNDLRKDLKRLLTWSKLDEQQ